MINEIDNHGYLVYSYNSLCTNLLFCFCVFGCVFKCWWWLGVCVYMFFSLVYSNRYTVRLYFDAYRSVLGTSGFCMSRKNNFYWRVNVKIMSTHLFRITASRALLLDKFKALTREIHLESEASSYTYWQLSKLYSSGSHVQDYLYGKSHPWNEMKDFLTM